MSKIAISNMTMDAAEALVTADDETNAALREWFNGTSETSRAKEDLDFGTWLDGIILFVAQNVTTDEREPAPEEIARAVKVQACGVPAVKRIAEAHAKGGTQTDTKFYVEEGIVNASVWVCGGNAHDHADEVAKECRALGFEVETLKEGGAEATVMCMKPFAEYAA